jgi:RHS repeat-associated protein
LWKEVDGVRTYFLYSDEGLIGEYDSSGTEIKTYGYKPGSTWTTDPLFMNQGGNYYFYHNDHLGTPQKMTGVNGGVVWEAKYSSFGEAEVESSSTITNNLRFPGQYFDKETGLHYNWHRYYDTKTGRYLSPDPSHSMQTRGTVIPYLLSSALNTLQKLNLYHYVHNNPTNKIDPEGLLPENLEWRQAPESDVCCGRWQMKSSENFVGELNCRAELVCVAPNGVILKKTVVIGIVSETGCWTPLVGQVCCR